MKDLFDNAIEALINKKDTGLFERFITAYSSREERHYCAYLFSWLINEPDSVELFFKNHTVVPEEINPLKTTNIPNLSKIMAELGLSSKLVDNYKNKLFAIIRKHFNQRDYM